MTVTDRDDAVQFTGSIVVAFRKNLRRLAKVAFEHRLEFGIGILSGASADHQQETSPLNSKRSVIGPVVPPCQILLNETVRVYDVVVEVDIFDKVLHQSIY